MDKVAYLISLDGTDDLQQDTLHSQLQRQLRLLQQPRGNASQWTGIIRGFSQKGVKAAEIEDSGILTWIGSQSADAKIEKLAVVAQIERMRPRIKRVTLNSPSFTTYRNITSGGYHEQLYILSSEAMHADDQIEDLLYSIEDLGFNPGPLISNPNLVDQLEAQMNLLKSQRPEMYDFAHHHYSGVVPAHGKNLMAHARISTTPDLFFVEEIQSDWAQKGRRNGWMKGFPKAPFITNTEQWSGLVLRDQLNQAAHMDGCKRFAWINAGMRNGFNQNDDTDDLGVFYKTIVKKIIEKSIVKGGGRVSEISVSTKHGNKAVLGFEMTDSVRAALKLTQPMYSRDAILPRTFKFADEERTDECKQVMQECQAMLGTAHTIRFVARLYDAAYKNEVPGQYFNKAITLSLRAKNLDRASRHEAWHFAEENFLFNHEKRELRLAFSAGSKLNIQTQTMLRSIGANGAADQCFQHQECAAHAFSLWCEGKLTVAEPKAQGIFERVLQSLNKMADWLEEKVFGVTVKTPEDLFEAMRNGTLAARAQAEVPEEMPAPMG